MTDAVGQRLALEAEADRLAALYDRILLAAQARRLGFLEAGREAVAKGRVSLADWDMLRDAHEGR